MWYLLALLAMVTGTPMPAATQAAATSAAASAGLTAFRDQAQLDAFFKRLRGTQRKRQRAMQYAPGAVPPPPMVEAPPPPPAPTAAADAAAEPAARATTSSPDGITNNQVAGVDEGGIVKSRGDMLVVLRRGRLFSVSTAGGGMRPVAAINAYAPGTDGSGDWYDEMLVSGDWVAVIGYSYARGGTQVNRFRLGPDGALSFVDAYSFRSQDYYSSRNYASRLIGRRLVLYAPISLDLDRPADAFPTINRWDERTRRSAGSRPLWSANNVFIPERLRNAGPDAITTVHSVTNCDLTAPVLDCSATSVLGDFSRTFFVSGNAVYVWTGLGGYGGGYGIGEPYEGDFSEGGAVATPPSTTPPSTTQPRRATGPGALVYRLPLDGSRPQAVAARGFPVDQFSFLADARRSALQVMVTNDGTGDRMWGPEWARGRPSLVTIPTSMFGTGNGEVPRTRYQLLPDTGTSRWGLQNRFVGDHLLYGAGGSGGGATGTIDPLTGRPILQAKAAAVNVVALDTRAVTRVALPHAVERLDAIGPDAIVIGQGTGYLGFSAIDLSATPALASQYRLPDASQGESRSQAFFFKPDAGDRSGLSGLLGLPVGRQVRGARGFDASAAVVFLRRQGRALGPNGELAALQRGARDDGCRASCVDWYGNARPIFRGDRIFALLGYELVEGRAGMGSMSEVGRVDMATLIGAPRRPPVAVPVDGAAGPGPAP